jgi:hypothetical protein
MGTFCESAWMLPVKRKVVGCFRLSIFTHSFLRESDAAQVDLSASCSQRTGDAQTLSVFPHDDLCGAFVLKALFPSI